MERRLLYLEDVLLMQMKGKFINITDQKSRNDLITSAVKTLDPDASPDDVKLIIQDMNDLQPIEPLLDDEEIEDIMVNNTESVFVHSSKAGKKKMPYRMENKEILTRFVNKLKLYATNESAHGNVLDVHMPNGSRANIVSSPVGYDVTIRNFKKNPFSILDLINNNELDYNVAARLWLYTDGLKVRPANILIGGMPASGKTTLLNSMFSFFRPEQRIVTIEETYELDTRTQENCVRLETSEQMPMEDLVKNALRMRPDLIIIGEVRGPEANDMITAMNIGKISMGTIHASTTRDIINRLQHTPMNVPMDIIPVIDALMVISLVYRSGQPYRRITQISEISGIETQVLLSDLYKFDYKTHQASPILPSVTYRDMIAKLIGVPPSDILAEEKLRTVILERLNKIGKRDIRSINEVVRDYYDNPEATLKKLGLLGIAPVIKV